MRSMSRRLTCSAVLTMTLLTHGGLSDRAMADGPPSRRVVSTVSGGQQPAAGARSEQPVPAVVPESTPTQSTAPAGPLRVCELYELPTAGVTASTAARDKMTAATAPVDGQRYYQECHTDGLSDEVGRVIDYTAPAPAAPAAPALDPAALAVDAYQRVPLVAPTVQTSPPIGSPQLVGFPTWLWIDPAAWATFDATASVPGLDVTVTATPTRVDWDMGDGNHVTCDGPGTPWAPTTSEDADTDCDYTYRFTSTDQPGGTYTVTATITWAVTWAATGAITDTGTLTEATRSGTATLQVTERQAVISHGT